MTGGVAMKRILVISTRYALMQRIRMFLQRHADQFTLCGTADNSVLGMNLIESTAPDIVIMPTHMSFWDAEDLIHSLMLRGNCPIFLLLDDESSDLSPTAAAKVAAVLSEANFKDDEFLLALEAARDQKEAELPVYHSRFQTNSAVQHSLEVIELLMGLNPMSIQEAQQEYGRLRVGRRNCWVLLGSVIPPFGEDFDFLGDLDRLEDIFQSLINLLRPLGTCEICIYQERNLCILLEEGQQTEPNWEQWVEKINKQMDGMNMPRIQFEISDMPLSLDRWHKQCRDLVKLREMRFFYSPTVLRPNDKNSYKQFVPQPQLHDHLSTLAQALQSGRRSQIEDILYQLQELVCRSLSREIYSYAVSQMILLYHNLWHTLGQENGEGAYAFRLQQYKTVGEFFSSYSCAMDQLLEQVSQPASRNPIISELCQYIHRNLSDDLTLETLSLQVHVTPSYLSRLFKKEMKEPLNSYINQKRIQKAKTLLDADWRITDIAGMVGFDNAKYFSQVFKKMTGQTPQEYRQNLQGGGAE